MEALKKKQIELGRRMLLLGMGALALSSLLYAYLFSVAAEASPFFSKFTTLNWFIPAMVVLMGAGVHQGSKPVRWIFSGLLIASIAFECYLFASFGLPDTLSSVFFVITSLLGALTVYLIMIDVRVEEFLLFQRSKNYGEYVSVDGSDSTTEEAKPKSKPKKGAALLEEDEEFEVVESVRTRSKGDKSKREKGAWEDELGIYEED